mgnify:CR=1 FL=1|jgi:hypothetical protein|tara:strand:- start:6303 stop:7139 length:837 start_codon:yes stop_codon:yes gene_type:complete
MTEPFAILRVKKIKSIAAISAMNRHWFRTQNTFNSIEKKQKFNRVLKGSGDVLNDFREVIEAKGIKKFRKNGVLTLEFVATFSPEYIYQNTKSELKEDANKRVNLWLKNTMSWIDKTFGENCTSIIYHGDESTPHIHFVVTPLKKNKNGQYGLCAKDITGGKQKLRALQDSYHNEVKGCGLKRGIRRKTPKSHQSLSHFYSSIYHIEEKLLEKGLTSSEQSSKVNVFKAGIDKLLQLKDTENLSLLNKMKLIIRQLIKNNQNLKIELESYKQSGIVRR